MTIKDPSVSANGYQLLSLATSQLEGDHKEFDVFLRCFPHYY